MRLNPTQHERALPDGTCNAGKVFYNCQINHFRGCCSVDPCALPACPDTDSSSTTSRATRSKSTSQVSSRQTLASIPNSVFTATGATTTIQSTSIIPIIAVTSSTPTPTQTQTPQTQTPSSTPTSNPASTSGVSNTPIIAGTVSGVVVLAILSILLWFCCRRKRQKQKSRAARNSIAEYGVPTKEFVLDCSISSGNAKIGSDIFAPFGGRYDSPRLTKAVLHPRAANLAPKSGPTASHGIEFISAPTLIGSSHIDVNSTSDPTTPLIDQALPDPEKSNLFTPPPVHEHPFFHPLPGQDAEVPTYHPRVPILSNVGASISATQAPDVPQKSTLRSHPTYHISQLSTHPAFSKPPSPPREHGFPQRIPEVKQWRPLSPVRSTSSQQQSCQPDFQRQALAQQQQQTWRHSEQNPSTPAALTSHIPERSELEAHVPNQYLSPVVAFTPRADFDYADKYTDRRSQWTPLTRGNTDSSKYSGPIGLGLPQSTSSPAATSSFSTSNSTPNIRHELESPNPASNLSLALPRSTSTQMSNPLGSNLTSPRDGGHMMNWAASEEVYSHFESRIPSRSRSLDPASEEKEVVSPICPPGRWSGATAVQAERMSAQGASQSAGHGACHSACEGFSPDNGAGTWGSWSGR